MTPSNMSGALPMTTASMSCQVMPASSSARLAASRSSPAIETSCRLAAYFVWPTPTTATRLLTTMPPVRQRGSAGGTGRWSRGDGASCLAAGDARGRRGEPLEPADHHRPGGALDRLPVEPECLPQHELLMRVGRVQPRRVDVARTGLLAGGLGRGRRREVTDAE